MWGVKYRGKALIRAHVITSIDIYLCDVSGNETLGIDRKTIEIMTCIVCLHDEIAE